MVACRSFVAAARRSGTPGVMTARPVAERIAKDCFPQPPSFGNPRSNGSNQSRPVLRPARRKTAHARLLPKPGDKRCSAERHTADAASNRPDSRTIAP